MTNTPLAAPVTTATVRTRVGVTLARARNARAEVVTFTGLPDAGEHIAVLFPPVDGPTGTLAAESLVSGDGSGGPAAGGAAAPGTAPGGSMTGGSMTGGSMAARPAGPPPLVRVHSECLTGDIFGSARCDCGPQLDEAFQRLAAEGGVLLYLRQEGRGIGLYNKLDAYALQDRGKDTFEANRLIGRGEDERDYAAAAAMLHTLGLSRIRLLTNNPDKARQLQVHGISLASVIATGVHLTPENARYLEAKARLGGHTLSVTERRPT